MPGPMPQSRHKLTWAFAVHAPPPRGGRKVDEWLDDHGTVCARAFSNQVMYWIDWIDVGVFAFSLGVPEVRVWPQANVRPETIDDTFGRMLRPVVLQALGWQALHAGAVVGPPGVLAFCGRSGSGKSTLAFAMRQDAWQQFADDALVLQIERDRVMTCWIPFAPRLRPASRAHFAQLERAVPSSLQCEAPDTPLRAVFLLRQDSQRDGTRISLLPPARAFSMLLSHAHCFDAADPMQAQRLVEDYLALVAQVPVYTLEYAPGLQRLSRVAMAVIETANGPTEGRPSG
jgi:hypothetical protein